jgi:hypothetical protein
VRGGQGGLHCCDRKPRNGGGGARTEEQRDCQRKKKVEIGAKDLSANYKNFKGLIVKLNFPLLQGSNGKMTKIENV